ncbi:response regulator [Gluconobacter kondonii]|uniref:response regulator n=1 Tax=Gluconobacter kondonii TaxID=941463 RepID=UPI001B8AF070|nr:response regulator [Gluconobacter kondonii]MBS1065441.1 response regulator [Gluconobacter kondonii]MBS1080021.1 response regulator [Gluconobacter kondonii]MBS1082742.1 response regulator [Gluconobacter kondonii]
MTFWSAKGPSRPLILLVDDEEEILVALTDLLEDQYEILSTTDPLRALDLLREHRDVATIISDQRMPGLTGDQLLMQARAFSDARSILLTGYADLEAVVSALNQGQVQAYVHKPWDSDALRSLVGEVTQHCLAQRALRTEQALLRGLMEALPIGLVFSDRDGRCIRSNVRDESESGAETEQAHFPENLWPDVEAMRESVRRSGQEERLVGEVLAQEDGKTSMRWHELTRLALAWPEGAASEDAWQVSMDRDVTSRVAMESRLRQAEKLQSLGTLAGGIAHDFNNLLAAISGSLELLEDIADLDEASLTLLRNAADSAQRGAVLTRRLLQFGRPREARLSAVSLEQLLPGLTDLLRQSLKKRGAPAVASPCALCVEDLPQNLPLVWSDADQLEMALLNLCVNARDAMADGGTVRISARVVDQKRTDLPAECCLNRAVALDVVDEGAGMTPDIAARIFDPFFTTKDVGRGTGLGLSSVYGFLSRSYGEIVVDSVVGEGTRMTLILPVAQSGQQPGRQPERPGGVVGRSLKVLVLDDEAPVRMVTAGFLTQDRHKVTAVSSLEEALNSVDPSSPFDLAIVDMRMPDHDGLTCAAALQKAVLGLKVLFISGHTDDMPTPENGLLLPKPFTQDALRRAVAETMRPRQREHGLKPVTEIMTRE